MRLLDLYCKAGGAAMGYHLAGFDEIVGIDIEPQPHYPFDFMQGDALVLGKEMLEVHGLEFDAVHASPPCQKFSTQTKQHKTQSNHPDLVAPTRDMLNEFEMKYIIENVVGAPLINPVLLCGSMFDSERLRRHRLFESNVPEVHSLSLSCNHKIQSNCVSVTGHAGGSSTRDGANRFGGTELWREIMQIDWMTGSELAEAIPPFYTKLLGTLLLRHLM